MNRVILSVIVVLFLASNSAKAVLVNLVTNGEFETPPITTFDGYQIFANGLVPGWTAAGGSIELQPPWTAPSTGSDALGIGQHLEINVFGPDTVSQSVVTPLLLNSAVPVVLSFDAWLRDLGGPLSPGGPYPATGSYSVVGSASGELVASTPMVMNTTTWTLNTSSFTVVPGETLTLAFTGTGDGANSPHIDQVVLLADVAAVPEARAWLMLGMVTFGAGALTVSRRWRPSPGR